MKVLFVTTELQGLAKTGGLADAARALPAALRRLGHDVRIVIPYYRGIATRIAQPIRIGSITVPMGNSNVLCSIREGSVDGVPVYFVEHNDYFDRQNMYDDGRLSYVDNAERFAFLAKAALHVCRRIPFRPDIAHANDWTTALVPFYLKVHERDDFFSSTGSILTIHNAYFQGKFYGDKRHFIGVPDECFVSDIIEEYGGVNFLKAGLYYADRINAVSVGYANELLTPEGAHGIHDFFRRRSAHLRGILNGCDYESWDPATDMDLPARFDVGRMAGRDVCKAVLEDSLGIAANVGMFGIVGRLTKQKGYDYLLPVIRRMLREDVAFVVLGVGDSSIEDELHHLADVGKGRVVVRTEFNERLARLIFAGSDFILMPSLFEPCGLSQMYGMRYGAIPVVRSVGGLRDTVQDYAQLADTGTGFVFDSPTPDALERSLRRALLLHRRNPAAFRKLVSRAMKTRFTWNASAQQYIDMYKDALGSVARWG